MKGNIFLRLRAWFVPSFDWRYPVNWFAVGVVLLCSFFFGKSAFAFVDDGSWESGSYYGIPYYEPDGTGPTKEVACSRAGGDFSGPNPASCFFWNGTVNQWGDKGGFSSNPRKYSCSGLYEAHPQWVASGCSSVPGLDCPDSGTVKRVGTAVNGTFKDGKFVEELPDNGFQFGGVLSAGGCGFVSPNMLQAGSPGHGTDLNSQVKCTKSGSCFRYQNFVSEGAERPAGEYEPWSGIAGDPEYPEVPDEQTETSTDTRESRTSTTSTDPITEQVGDSTRTTQTTTTTETRGDGSVVQSQDDVTTVTRSDGITRTDTQTTVTTTNADGSRTVETTNNISYTQNPQTIYNIDNSTGRISVTATGGGTTSQQTRSTEGYNAQGERVSQSTEEGPVTGDDETRDSQEEENCSTNPLLDRCIGEFKETAKGEFGDIAGKVLDAKQEYMDIFDEVKEQAADKLNFNLSGGGSTSDYVVSFRGGEGNIGITRWFSLFDEYDLAALVMAIAALIAVFVILRA